MNDIKRMLAIFLLAGAALSAGGAPQAMAEDGAGLVGLLGLHDGSKEGVTEGAGDGGEEVRKGGTGDSRGGGDGGSVTISGNDSVSRIG
ncbi:hypothetical protein [Streptomyces sp. NPDC048577]|uniref:hypothetical protein n=1 Tax=Streptomyces sp. NPDC048577 TaxID=3157209 RepID=UPI003429150C